MNKPIYPNKPIAYVTSLAKTLSIDSEQLAYIADNANTFYRLRHIPKSNGSDRTVYSVKPKLKSLQTKIKNRIFIPTIFPTYLKGALRGTDHFAAAEAHIGAKILVGLDIKNFFPSVSSNVVFKIWKYFFNFPESVACILTKLTTYENALPQGAPTSSYLANLTFWDREYELVRKLRAKSFTYTRFVDDITISSEQFIDMRELEPIFRLIFGMFKSKGVKPNRSKITISTSGHKMEVHNLNIKNGITVTPEERKRIRAAVYQCEYKHENSELSYELWESTYGRVAYLDKSHPNKAQKYKQILDTIKPQKISP